MRALLIDVRTLVITFIIALCGCASAYRPDQSAALRGPASHVVVSGNVPVASGQPSAVPFEILDPIESRSDTK